MTEITMPIVATMPPRASSRVETFAPKPRAVAMGPTLPEVQEQAFEANLRKHYALVAERDELKAERDNLKSRLAAAEAAIAMLESNVNATESRVVSYQAERDQVVAERGELKGKYETVFQAIANLLDQAAVSLVKEAVNEPDAK